MARTLMNVAALVLLAAATTARADIIFTATLTTGQEPPPIILTTGPGAGGIARPTPFGTATFMLNDAQTALRMIATITNIDVNGLQTPDIANDNLVAAHIHAANATGPLTFPVVWGFFGSPDNDTNAGVADVVAPFATGVGGTFASIWDVNEGNGGTTLTAQLPNIFAGRSYINFHTVQNPGGEIRGALLLPEPGSIALLAIALLGLGFSRRKRR